MTLDLDELERLEAAATPGPWETIADPLSGVPAFVKTPGELIAADAPADAAFIAAARNALPGLLAELRALRARVRCSACLPWENPCETCARTAERINATPPEPAAPLSRCWRCKHDVPEDTVVCFAGVGTQCKDRKACRERSYVAPEPATPPEHPQTQNAYRLGCIVGAAIVAWGDAMREREEGKRRAKDLEALMLEEDMG